MALAIDGSTPALATNAVAATATVTTASFTPPAGALLLVMWTGNSALNTSPGSPTITDNLGAHLTYTLLDWQSRASAPTKDGQTAIWSAVVGSSAAMTVTVTNAAASGSREAALRVIVITGQHATPIGTHSKTGSTGASSIAQGFTGTASNSWGFLADCDWDLKGTQTAGTGCTLLSAGSIGSAISYGFVRRTTADGTNGGTTTMNVTLPGSSTNLGWCWAEVIPSAGSSVTGDVTLTETVTVTADAAVTPAPPPPSARFTTAAVTAARSLAGRGQVILIRTPIGGVGNTADVALTETVAVSVAGVVDHPSVGSFTETVSVTTAATRAQAAAVASSSTVTVTADAAVTNTSVAQPGVFDFTEAGVTRAAALVGRPQRVALIRTPISGSASSGDVTLAETWSATTAATRGQAAAVAATQTVTVAADAAVSNAGLSQPTVLDFTDAAATRASALRAASARAIVVRTPSGAAAGAADVTLAVTVTVTTAATRGQSAASTLTETVAVTADASVNSASSVAQPSVLDFTQAAVAAAQVLVGRPRPVMLARSPSVPTVGVAVTETWSVTADASTTSSAVPQPAVFDFTQAAQSVAGWMYGRAADPITLFAPAEASTAQTADVALTQTWTASTAVTRGQGAAVAVTQTWTVTATGARGQSAAVALTETVTITADAVATTPGTAAVILTETVGITPSASLGARPSVSLTETWTVAATAQVGVNGLVTQSTTVTVTATATASTEPVKATSTDSVTARRTSLDAVEARRTSLTGVS